MKNNKEMKTYIFIIIMLFGLLSTNANAQVNENFEEFVNQYYEGGHEAFLQHVYKQIKYPLDARINCGIGNLHIKLILRPDQGLQVIEYLNNFGLGVHEDVTTILNASNESWKGLGESREIEFSIAYQIDESPVIDGDIKVIAYAASETGGDSGCISSEELLSEVQNWIKKKKYKEIPPYWDELVRRGYKNQAFLDLMEQYGEQFNINDGN